MMQTHWHNSLWFIPFSALVAPAYAADYLSIQQAQEQIFPADVTFVESPIQLSDAEIDLIKARSGVRQRQSKQPYWRVERDGKLIGWFLIDDVIGKHEYISYAMGIDLNSQITGLEIMSYRETHGGQVRELLWREQFIGKTLTDPFKLDEDVSNISGATLSCRNLLDGSKRLLILHQLVQQRALVL